MESENNATLIDTLSLIFARAAELGALAPPILNLHMRTHRANSRLLRSLSSGLLRALYEGYKYFITAWHQTFISTAVGGLGRYNKGVMPV